MLAADKRAETFEPVTLGHNPQPRLPRPARLLRVGPLFSQHDYQRRCVLGRRAGALALLADGVHELDGEELRPTPLEQRKGKLEKLLAGGDGIRFSEHLDGDGAIIFAPACTLGLEGIVSKRRDLPYRSGRCMAWIKIENRASPAVLRIQDGTW